MFKFAIHGKCEVTQLDYSEYSHRGSTAWDICSRDTRSDLPYSCNADVIVKAVDKRYAFVWWETLEKVQLPNGKTDYLTIMTGHDSHINAKVGQVVPKGTQLGNMGTGGNATG